MSKTSYTYYLEPADNSTVDDFGKDIDEDTEITIDNHLDIDIVDMYSEWAKPYGHKPYVRLIIDMKPNQNVNIMLDVLEQFIAHEYKQEKIIRRESAGYH